MFEIIKVVALEAEDEGRAELYIFFWVPTSIAEAAVVIPNGAKNS